MRPMRGDWAKRQASACSRPPLPITRRFIETLPTTNGGKTRQYHSMAEMTHTGQSHYDSMLIRGLDDFFIAHAADRLDYCNCSSFCDYIHPVPNRKESVRSYYGTCKRQAGVFGFDCRDARA